MGSDGVHDGQRFRRQPDLPGRRAKKLSRDVAALQPEGQNRQEAPPSFPVDQIELLTDDLKVVIDSLTRPGKHTGVVPMVSVPPPAECPIPFPFDTNKLLVHIAEPPNFNGPRSDDRPRRTAPVRHDGEIARLGDRIAGNLLFGDGWRGRAFAARQDELQQSVGLLRIVAAAV